MVVSGQKPFIEDNAQKTRLFNVATRAGVSGGTFSSYVQVDDDQAFLLDGWILRWAGTAEVMDCCAMQQCAIRWCMRRDHSILIPRWGG